MISEKTGKQLQTLILGVAIAFVVAGAVCLLLRFTTGDERYGIVASICAIATAMFVSASGLLSYRMKNERREREQG